MELAHIHIPHSAREHIQALLPYAVGYTVQMSAPGVVGWELKLRIPKDLINPDVDIQFLNRHRITMQVEPEDDCCMGYGPIMIRESPYYNINLSFNE